MNKWILPPFIPEASVLIWNSHSLEWMYVYASPLGDGDAGGDGGTGGAGGAGGVCRRDIW